MFVEETLNMLKESKTIDENDCLEITKILDMLSTKYNINIDENHGSFLLYHLCAAYGRRKSGEKVEPLEKAMLEDLENLPNYKLSLEVLHDVDVIANNKLGDNEESYLLLHINNLIV